ncbi:MAG: hypothetical protein ACPGRE_04965 [Flavobacteriaceae bacterium]
MESNATSTKLELNQLSINHLIKTSKWAKFLSIMGFIMTGIMVLAAIGMLFFSGTTSSALGMGVQGILFSVIYLIMALIYAYPCYLLLKFSNNVSESISNGDSGQLEQALKNQSDMYTFFGIFTIIILAIYLIGIVIALGGALLF